MSFPKKKEEEKGISIQWKIPTNSNQGEKEENVSTIAQ